LHPPRILTGAVSIAAILAALLAPDLFRRPATTISTLAEIAPIAGDLAMIGEPCVDGSIRGVWTIFPYRIGTILLPDSSVLSIIGSPARLDPGMPAPGTTSRHLGGWTYALASPSPSGSSSSARLLGTIGTARR